MREKVSEIPVEHVNRSGRLVDAARLGSRLAFSAFVLRDDHGRMLDFEYVHLAILNFIDYCWYPKLRVCGQHAPAIACDDCERLRSLPSYYCGILAPWAHGKSTLGPIGVSLHEIGKDRNVRIKLVCASDKEALERTAAIRRYMLSESYQTVFPHIKPAPSANWSMHEMFVERDSLAQDPTLSAATVQSGAAGIRADILILDDIVSHANSIENAAERPKIYSALTSVWLRRINPDSRVLLTGTRWHHDDAYGRVMREQRGLWLWMIAGISQDFARISVRIVESE